MNLELKRELQVSIKLVYGITMSLESNDQPLKRREEKMNLKASESSFGSSEET
jgi:hypothetical protein